MQSLEPEWCVCGKGGMNTAGLGGVGGPYRLDAGHDVFQVSDFDKSQVPEDVRRFHSLLSRAAFALRCVMLTISINASSSVQQKLISYRWSF